MKIESYSYVEGRIEFKHSQSQKREEQKQKPCLKHMLFISRYGSSYISDAQEPRQQVIGQKEKGDQNNILGILGEPVHIRYVNSG